MPTERRAGLARGALVLLGALLAASAAAEPAPPAPPRAPPGETPPPAGRPEHEFRPLPADTFKPSETISEDFPVPFPVDI